MRLFAETSGLFPPLRYTVLRRGGLSTNRSRRARTAKRLPKGTSSKPDIPDALHEDGPRHLTVQGWGRTITDATCPLSISSFHQILNVPVLLQPGGIYWKCKRRDLANLRIQPAERMIRSSILTKLLTSDSLKEPTTMQGLPTLLSSSIAMEAISCFPISLDHHPTT